MRLLADEGTLELRSNVTNRTSAALTVQTGETTRFNRQPLFASGLGKVEASAHGHVPWFGAGSARQAYVLAYPDGPAEVFFTVHAHGHDEQLAARSPSPGSGP